ncbi:MAG: energy transducer TonB [Crocinitomicaceae bacterium]
MKLYLFFATFISVFVYGQIIELPVSSGENNSSDEEIFTIVEQQPEFPGGFENMILYIQGNFVYPKEDFKNKIQGTVYIQFVIEKDGSVSNIRVIRGVSESLDAEAIRVIQMMPKWEPGRQRGKAVRARFTLPIRCNIPEEEGKKKKKKKK